MDKYEKDGYVAVLVSPGYGAGWSTWAYSYYSEFLAMDKTLVEMKMRSASVEEVEKYCVSVTGDESFYTGGWNQVIIKWLKKGTLFTIQEYDGSESILTVDDLEMEA